MHYSDDILIGIASAISFMWMTQNLTGDTSTLTQAASQYPKQCRRRSPSTIVSPNHTELIKHDNY